MASKNIVSTTEGFHVHLYLFKLEETIFKFSTECHIFKSVLCIIISEMCNLDGLS